MRIFGIDPGLTGAFALLDINADGGMGAYSVEDIPTFATSRGREYAIATLADRFCALRIGVLTDCFLEQSQPMPKQGVRSMFTVGVGFGIWLSLLAVTKTPFTLVRPATWKKALGMSKDKEVCRKRAMELFPHAEPRLRRKMDHGRAEALLLAYYGMIYTTRRGE